MPPMALGSMPPKKKKACAQVIKVEVGREVIAERKRSTKRALLWLALLTVLALIAFGVWLWL